LAETRHAPSMGRTLRNPQLGDERQRRGHRTSRHAAPQRLARLSAGQRGGRLGASIWRHNRTGIELPPWPASWRKSASGSGSGRSPSPPGAFSVVASGRACDMVRVATQVHWPGRSRPWLSRKSRRATRAGTVPGGEGPRRREGCQYSDSALGPSFDTLHGSTASSVTGCARQPTRRQRVTVRDKLTGA
jgi:hypothetical protein